MRVYSTISGQRFHVKPASSYLFLMVPLCGAWEREVGGIMSGGQVVVPTTTGFEDHVFPVQGVVGYR